MARRRSPLLAELDAHTTWSDGELTPAALVDLYGAARFDVLAITDHVVATARHEYVRAETFAAYLDEIDADAGAAARVPACFACEPEWAAEVVDRFELVNRDEVFGWVADRRLPAVASGDFHRPEHLATRKSLLSCRQHEEEVVGELRSRRPCAPTRVDSEGRPARRAA